MESKFTLPLVVAVVDIDQMEQLADSSAGHFSRYQTSCTEPRQIRLALQVVFAPTEENQRRKGEIP